MKKPKSLNYNMLIVLVLSFLLVQLLGLLVGVKLSGVQAVEQMPSQESLIWFAMSFLIATSMILLALKFLKGKLFFGGLFIFILFIGSQAAFSAFLPEILAVLAAALLVLLRYVEKSSITHNITIGVAIAGIGAQLGLMLPVSTVLILFVGMSIYDVFAVYKSKHMIKMFKGLSKRGVLLSLAIPEKKAHVKKSLKNLKPGKKSGFIMLGTGDVVFPLILAVSVLSYGIISSLFVILGSLFGVLTVFYLLNKKREPLPALPPIALFSALGFLISLLFSFY